VAFPAGPRFWAYYATVLAAGLGLLGGLVSHAGWQAVRHAPAPVWLLCALALAAELLPITVPGRGRTDPIVLSAATQLPSQSCSAGA
jgi:hypothetical protein